MASSAELMEQLAKLAASTAKQLREEQQEQDFDTDDDSYELPNQAAKTAGKSGF